MRVEYDEVVHVERLKRQMSAPHLERANGFAFAWRASGSGSPGLSPHTLSVGPEGCQSRSETGIWWRQRPRRGSTRRSEGTYSLSTWSTRWVLSVMTEPTASSYGDLQTV